MLSHHLAAAVAEGDCAVGVLDGQRMEYPTSNNEATLRNRAWCFACHVAFGSWVMGRVVWPRPWACPVIEITGLSEAALGARRKEGDRKHPRGSLVPDLHE